MAALDHVEKIVHQWQPEPLPTELKYRDSLCAILRRQMKDSTVETEYRHIGTTIDIYVKKPGFLGSTEVFIELKRNLLHKAQLDRLVGQIDSLRPGKNAIIVILCGKTNPALASRFKEKYEIGALRPAGFNDPVTLVLKEDNAPAEKT